MKIAILISLLYSFIFGYEETIDDRKAFDTLLIKMGITSLTKDFENEKENILKNSNDIEELKAQVKFLLQENLKLKLNVSDSNLSIENEALKTKLQLLESQLQIQKSKPIIEEAKQELQKGFMMKVMSKDIGAYEVPFPNSRIVLYYNQFDLINIESCNQYGWCKIVDKEEYLPEYKLKKVK